MEQIKLVKDLKEVGPAPDGHTYVGGSLAYWQYDKDSAFKCYDMCRWTSGGKPQPVRVWIAPDHESTQIHQVGYVTTEAHNMDDCEHCGLIFERNMENNG